jgi:2',5'-phosphodiesterase
VVINFTWTFGTLVVYLQKKKILPDLQQAVRVPLQQSLRLKSACGTPKYTNFTAGFADCLDYIYCEAANFDVVQVVPLPSHEELSQHTALPSVVFPSDHVSLVSDLKWT